jgi:hypothetical protein
MGRLLRTFGASLCVWLVFYDLCVISVLLLADLERIRWRLGGHHVSAGVHVTAVLLVNMVAAGLLVRYRKARPSLRSN